MTSRASSARRSPSRSSLPVTVAPGILVGFASEDLNWPDYRLEHDRGFLDRIASARASIQAGRGVRIEDLHTVLEKTEAPNHARQRTGAALVPAASAPPPSRSPRSGRANRADR